MGLRRARCGGCSSIKLGQPVTAEAIERQPEVGSGFDIARFEFERVLERPARVNPFIVLRHDLSYFLQCVCGISLPPGFVDGADESPCKYFALRARLICGAQIGLRLLRGPSSFRER